MIHIRLEIRGNADDRETLIDNNMELKKRGLDWAVVDLADMDLAFQGTHRKTERCNNSMCCPMLCNESLTVVKNGVRDFMLTSPDEVALRRVTAKVGFEMTARTRTLIEGVVCGENAGVGHHRDVLVQLGAQADVGLRPGDRQEVRAVHEGPGGRPLCVVRRGLPNGRQDGRGV